MSANKPPESNSLPLDENTGPILVRVLTSTLITALLIFTARIYTRIRMFRLWWDDYALCCAIAFAIAGYGTLVASIARGFGRHIFYLKPADATFVGRMGLIVPLLWLWSTTLVRVSMALMLLRLKSDKRWKWGLKAMLGIQVVCAVTATIINLVQCTPIQANWIPSLPGAKCWKPVYFQVTMYCISGIFIVSDIIFSLLPLTFIWTIRRQLVEKVVLAFLMSLGISASAAAMIKITKFKQYDVMTDPSWSLAQMGMWGWLEVHIGIIAASLPCLNGPFQRGMRRLGLTSPMTSHGSGTANFPAGARSAGNGDVFLKSPSTTVNGGESVAVIDEERLLAEERGEIIKMLIKTEELN